MTKANGFATKRDVLKLERKMDKRFEQVDKRFETVETKLEELKGEFGGFRGWIKEELEFFKHDSFSEFNSRWMTLIDPILKDIERHREQEVLWVEQDHRRDEKIDRMEKILDQVAKKVGV